MGVVALKVISMTFLKCLLLGQAEVNLWDSVYRSLCLPLISI